MKSEANLGKIQDTIQKITKAKRTGDMAQVAECLPSKHEEPRPSTYPIPKTPQ
jgi:hypothetical protein